MSRTPHELNKQFAAICRSLRPSPPDPVFFRTFRKLFLTPAFKELRKGGIYAYTTPTKVMATNSWGFSTCEENTDGSFVYYTTQAADGYGVDEEMRLGHHFKSDEDREFTMLVLNDHIPLVEWNGDTSKKIRVGVTPEMKINPQ